MLPPNYIPDQNRFKLAGPPDFFRRSLWAFDDSLVIIPSRQSYVYRLAQRRKPNLSTAVVNEALFNESDTKMLASYNLVPVTSITVDANWSNPLIIEMIRRSAPWRNGGAEKVNAALDAEEAYAEQKKAEAEDARLTDVSKDAWKYYLIKTGLRTSLHTPKGRRASSPNSKADRAINQSTSSETGRRSSSSNSGTGTIFLP